MPTKSLRHLIVNQPGIVFRDEMIAWKRMPREPAEIRKANCTELMHVTEINAEIGVHVT